MDLRFFDFTQHTCYPKVFIADRYPNPTYTENVLSKPGKSETFFEYKLSQYFKNLLIRNVQKNNYKPDYILVSDNKDVIIDIEVDEPYSFKESKPIHFIGKDDERDSFFIKEGWDIIRFSESQVVNHPNG